ncbi:plasmid partitioning protein ParB [Fervidicella metallireducens AeB]|uniref:Plasmid partitioning protein ParB n=1 Tax=Fervidicella metallireducens AeB TaxID=1403537 RepID=A0A017RXJ7_9CLOT|nr:ParB/RepB/Spo0J family partition protein [Fervidicella metallireducens]EYE88650.1 plasmid partitioning protein ParB [Fervidicella metallireducens AeB]
MTAKKSALGKGLGALIPEIENTVQEENINSVKEIDINHICPNEEQPRKNFDDEKLNLLAQSIKDHGIIQPVLVKKEGEYYKIIAGERRWRAARIAGLKKIPVIEKELSETETMEISLIENLQREDLNPIEEAIAYKKLIDDFGFTQEKIANRIGKSRPAIANSLRLLNLDGKVMEYLIDGTLSEGHGRVLVSIEDKKLQYELAKKIIDENLNVRQTEKLISSLHNKNKKSTTKPKKEIFIKDIEDRLKHILGTKVTINKGRKKGKIEIEYYSDEDLERIIDMFNV